MLENLKRLSEASRLGWEGPLRVVQPHTDADVDDLQLQLEGVSAVSPDELGRLGTVEVEPEPEPEEGRMETSLQGQVAPPAVGDFPLASPPDFSAPFPGTDIRDSRAVRQGMGGGLSSPAVGGFEPHGGAR